METTKFNIDYVSKRVDVFCDAIDKVNFQDIYWIADGQFFEIEINDAEEYGTFRYTRCTFENSTVGKVLETKIFELEDYTVYAALFAATTPKGTEVTTEFYISPTLQTVCSKMKM